MESDYQRELDAIGRFIACAEDEDIAMLLSKILGCHGLWVWDAHTKRRKPVQMIHTGRRKVQLIIDTECDLDEQTGEM